MTPLDYHSKFNNLLFRKNPHQLILSNLFVLAQLDVKEARKVESHPQWDMSEDEDGDKADADLTETDDDSYDESKSTGLASNDMEVKQVA